MVVFELLDLLYELQNYNYLRNPGREANRNWSKNLSDSAHSHKMTRGRGRSQEVNSH